MIEPNQPDTGGLACLAAALVKLGSHPDVLQKSGESYLADAGSSAQALAKCAHAAGVHALIVQKVSLRSGQLQLPAILQADSGSFLLLSRLGPLGYAQIFESPLGWHRVRTSDLSRRFSGTAIELSAKPPFAARPGRSVVSPLGLVGRGGETVKLAIVAIAISLLAQIFTVISPLFLRHVLDDAVAFSDRGLLVRLAIGFGLFATMNSVVGLIRGAVLQSLNRVLGWEMARRVIHHLMGLSLQWFERRRLADVLNRLSGADQVRGALLGVLAIMFDAPLALISLVMLFLGSSQMFVVAVVGVSILLLIRHSSVPAGMRLSNRAVLAAAAEQGKRIETVRAIQSIKTANGETEREADWLARVREMLSTSYQSSVFHVAIGSGLSFVGAVANIAAIYLGADLVIRGQMSVGTMMATLAYLSQFNQSMNNLIQQSTTFRMLDVQLERLSDIVFEPVETGSDQNPWPATSPRPVDITCRNLSFRYQEGEPFIFRDLNLDVRQEEHVAIVGPSGCGKSTLLKLLTGLYRPNEGEIRIGGRPLDHWGSAAARSVMGVVMQSDELFAGTVAENVVLFSENIDRDHVFRCLDDACLLHDIEQLPQGLDTELGDRGGMLSGGQKQRLLIARALYRRPKILLLDEATSHLDIPGERAVVTMLARLNMTRIIVAHRPHTIAGADRVIRMNELSDRQSESSKLLA